MKAQSLSLKSFRNYESLSLELHPNLNLFIGKNGHGKTNLLESLYYMATGQPLRSVKERDMIRWNEQILRLYLIFKLDERENLQHLKMSTDGSKRFISLNGVTYKSLNELPQRLLAIPFTPDDLAIIKGSPEKRRNFIDREIGILSPTYDRLRRKYQRLVSQRNEALKEVRAHRLSPEGLAPWNQQLILTGSQVILARLDFLKTLVPLARKIHRYIAHNDKNFDITYQSSFGKLHWQDQNDVQNQFAELLERHEREEIQRGVSLYGPHRDDLIFYENGIDLRTFGSQGQQRTAILALKIAEISVIENLSGEKPILLLDDVMSELDPERQRFFLEIITKKSIQTIITGTNIDFNLDKRLSYQVFKVSEGKIIPEAN